MHEHYVEEERRYSHTGRELIRKFRPHKMSAYKLAQPIAYHLAARDDIYRDCMMERLGGYINDKFEQVSLQTEAPSPEQTEKHKKRISAFTKILCTNLDLIVEDVLEKDDAFGELQFIPQGRHQSKRRSISRPLNPHLSYDQYKTNEAIFMLRMQRKIDRLFRSKGVAAVCQDYLSIQEIKENPKRIGELESWCKDLLFKAASIRSIRGIDPEEQYAECFLTIWKSAQLYQGRKFARFRTMARKSLHNKVIDLLRYSLADVRKINRFSIPLSSTTNADSSYAASRVDDLAMEAWTLAQREENGVHNPFHTVNIFDFFNIKSSPYLHEEKGELRAFSETDYQEVDSENFPSLDGRIYLERIPDNLGRVRDNHASGELAF